MKDTNDIINRIENLWDQFSKGDITGAEARTHIGFARTILDAKKVEIAVAHLNVSHIPAVALATNKPMLKIARRKAA